MKKHQFIQSLRSRLSWLDSEEREERISFYSEMIDDKIDEGICEEDAVESIGSVEKIENEILDDIPIASIIKKKVKRKTKDTTALRWIFLVLGAPIWLSLLIAFFAVVFSVIVSALLSVFALVISFWAVEICLVACALVGVVVSAIYFVGADMLTGGVFICTALTLLGIAILAFHFCKFLTQASVKLTKGIGVIIKKILIKKESA